MIKLCIPRERGLVVAAIQYLENVLGGLAVAPPDDPHTLGAAPEYDAPVGGPVEYMSAAIADAFPPLQVADFVPPGPAATFQPDPYPSEFGPDEPAATYNVHPAVDGRGFPWDARIHSSSKALLAKKPCGWKPMRGVSPQLVAQVEAEYIAQGYGKSEAQAAAVIVPPAPHVATDAALIPPPPAVGADTLVAKSPLTFQQVIGAIGQANKIHEAQTLLPSFQLASLSDLGARPDLWLAFTRSLGIAL